MPGQAPVSRSLLNSFNRDRLASTYLFVGADGYGKWATAIALAALVNCENPKRDESGKVLDSCAECRHCRQIENFNFAELFFALPLPPHKNESEYLALYADYIERKKKEPFRIIYEERQQTIPIETAFDIRKKIGMKPLPGATRVILFYQMEKMLKASADALLKMIEEPPRKTIIIMTATDPDELLPTIVSRAQRIRFRPYRKEEVVSYLVERYGASKERAHWAAHLAGGSLGRAVNIIEDEAGSALRQTSFLLFKDMLTRNAAAFIPIFSELINPRDRGAAEQILFHWQSFISDIIGIRHGRKLSEIANIDLGTELETLSSRIQRAAVFEEMLKEIKETNLGLRRNVHIRVGMTALGIKLSRRANQTP
jgi:DNA polymerase-3 subunit delta'